MTTDWQARQNKQSKESCATDLSGGQGRMSREGLILAIFLDVPYQYRVPLLPHPNIYMCTDMCMCMYMDICVYIYEYVYAYMYKYR